MLQRLMNKKVVIGLLGILILLAAFGRIMTTPAEEYRFVTWEKGTSENEVKVSVMLSAREDVQKAGTFQVQFGVASDDPDGIEDIKFKFDSDLKNNSDVTVKTYRYNQSNGTLTIYVSGVADDILKISESSVGLTPWYDRAFGAGEGTEFNNKCQSIFGGKDPVSQFDDLEKFAQDNKKR